MRVVLIVLGVLAALAFAWAFFILTEARAHDAPSGWKYPFSCCSDYDCRHTHPGAVKQTPAGFVVPSGEVIPYDDKRIRFSEDEDTHWCSKAGSDTGETICLFIPKPTF